MKLDWETILNVGIALLIFKVLDKLFLDEALDKVAAKIKGE